MKKKTILIASLSVVMAAAVATGATLAYFTSQQEIKNNFNGNVATSGNIEMNLDEAVVTYANDVWTATDERTTEGNTYGGTVYPGAELPKDPTLTVLANSEDAYARIKVTFDNVAGWTEAGVADPSSMLVGVKADKWTKSEGVVSNGSVTYTYTYNDRISAGDAGNNLGGALFTSVQVSPDIENMALLTENGFNITVSAEGVQARGFDNAAAAFAATFDKEN